MTLKLILPFAAIFLLVVNIQAQPEAQGGSSLADLIAQAERKTRQTSTVDPSIQAVIQDIFSNSETTESSTKATTKAPTINSNSGGQQCTCVPYYLCNNGSINTNGEGIIDIRINEGPCDSYIEVCCNKEDQREEPITPPPPLVEKKGCGYRHADGIGFRITGDKENESQFGEFPWMIAVLQEESVADSSNKLNVYQCGGALIHPQMVVTAAHCVNNKKKKYKIRAGEWDSQTTQELYPYQDRDVKTVIIHPQYYAGALYNDVAVLYLSSPVEIAKNVETICLPPQGTSYNSATCYATGWGKNIFGQKGRYQVILKKIDLPLVSNPVCQDRLRTTRLGKFFELHKSFICAGGQPGKDTCKGDGGSPLVCPIAGDNDDRYYQMGIVAWGIGCGENNIPGVYVNLALFRDWIDNQMRTYELDIASYTY